MKYLSLSEVPWLYLNKEEPEQEFPIEIICQEYVDEDSGESMQKYCITLPEYGADELRTAEKPLVIGRGPGLRLHIYRADQWEAFFEVLETSHSEDELQLRTIKRFFYANAYESEMIEGKIYIPEHLMRLLEIREQAVLYKYKIAEETYYAVC